MFKKEKIIIFVLLIVGVIFSLNSAWALSLDEADTAAQSTAEASNSSGRFTDIYVDSSKPLDFDVDEVVFIPDLSEGNTQPIVPSQFSEWRLMNLQEGIIPSQTILKVTPSLVEAIRVDLQGIEDVVALENNVKVLIEGVIPNELPEDFSVEREMVIESVVSYITTDCFFLREEMEDVALYSAVVSILGLDIPVSLEISYDDKSLKDGMALITALKEELKITEVNFLLDKEVDSYSIVVRGEGESDVILDIADFREVKHIKAKAILTTKHGDYQLEGGDSKFILTEPDYFDPGTVDLENEPVSISGGRELEFSSLRYVEEYRSLVDSMENYGECPKISAPAFRLIGTVPEAGLEVRLTGGEYEQELREIGAVINYVDQEEFVYRITVSPNKILDLIGLDFVSYVDVHSGE